MQEMLTKQAEGLAEIVKAAGGNPDSAVQLILADKMEELMKIQVEAVKDIKIDKVTVWDSGNGENGKTSTANFLSGLMKSIPPVQDTLKMSGLTLPDYIAKSLDETKTEAPKENKEAE